MAASESLHGSSSRRHRPADKVIPWLIREIVRMSFDIDRLGGAMRELSKSHSE